MKEKIIYEEPQIAVIALSDRDILTTSVGSDNGFDGEVDSSWG